MNNTPGRLIRIPDTLWAAFGKALPEGQTRSGRIRELIEADLGNYCPDCGHTTPNTPMGEASMKRHRTTHQETE